MKLLPWEWTLKLDCPVFMNKSKCTVVRSPVKSAGPVAPVLS